MTHQERQKACLQLTIATAIPKKEKRHCYIWNPEKQVAKHPPAPNAHSWVSAWWIPDCSEVQVRAYTLRSGVLRNSSSCFALLIISSHCTVTERFSNPRLLSTCQSLLNGQISLWTDTCTISNLHQISPVPSPRSLLSSFHPQFLNMMLLITHFGQAVLKYTPTVT